MSVANPSNHTTTMVTMHKEPTLSTSTPTISAMPTSQASTLAAKADNGNSLAHEADVSNFVPLDLAKQMQEASAQASQLLKSLSHPDRLLLLCQLTQGEYCVGELERLVGVGQPSLSQQLGILRKDKLVATRREGKQIYYSIASEDALAVLQLLYQRFCAPKKQ